MKCPKPYGTSIIAVSSTTTSIISLGYGNARHVQVSGYYMRELVRCVVFSLAVAFSWLLDILSLQNFNSVEMEHRQ